MTSSPQKAAEARGWSEPFGPRSRFYHAQTYANSLFLKWCYSWRDGTEMEDAIAVLEIALHDAEELSYIEPTAPAALLRLQGIYYRESLFRQGRKIDAEEGARCFLKALQYEPSDTLAMSSLSWIYLSQAYVTGSRTMLDDAIDLSEHAVAQTQADREGFPYILEVAAMCLIKRAQFDGYYEDLEIAAQLLLVGLALPNLVGNDPAMLRLLLAEIHLLQFESLENPEDIDRVEALLGQVSSTCSVHAKHKPYLIELRGKMYKTKWEFFRAKNDLEASCWAYKAMHEAIKENSACPSWKTTDAIMGWAKLFGMLAHYVSSDESLSMSYLLANEAYKEAKKRASEWHLSSISRVEAQAQFVIGETLELRYMRYHSTQLLENAISAFRQSVLMTDLKDADFVERTLRLSTALRVRSTINPINHYQRQAHLYEARHWAGKLIWSRPLRRWQHVGCVLELGHHLSGSGAPVDRVIQLYQHAVKLDTTHFESRVKSWSYLAETFILRGRNTKCIEDLDTARAYLERVEMLERETDNHSTSRMLVAATLQSEYHILTGDLTYRVQAACINHSIFSTSQYPLIFKLNAAGNFMIFSEWLARNRNSDIEKMLQTMSITIFDSTDTPKVAEECVDLMTRLVSKCCDQAQQLLIIRELVLLPLCNVFCAIRAGKDTVAVINALEKGRSIFWDRLVNRKGQVVELEEKHVELASQYRDLRKRLDQTAQPIKYFEDQPQDKFLQESEMNNLVAKIRQQDGFKDFLLPPLETSKLQTYGAHGPVVMLLAGPPTGGYALVTSTDSIFTMRLLEYTPEACQRHYELLRQALELACYRQDQARAADLLYQVLNWLWESAAKPVLDRLGFVGFLDPSDGPPRVWWITCGWVNRLPIHAAGDHLRRLRTNEPCTVMDRVISSYSATLKSLMYSRTRMQELVKQSSTITEPPIALLAAMEETIDRPKLDEAVREVKCVQPILEPQFHVCSFTDPPPTRKDVVTNVRQCTIAHLACHGEADPSDPLQSKILLYDWGRKALRVGFIMRMDMENCQLAYLSACETAVNKDEKLAEEGLHISGAFQMAGVPNTVATWWEIVDQEAVAVAEGFYGRLKDEEGRIDVGRAAGALRGTLVEMRDAGVSPLVWGSYVHFGA